MLRIGRRGKACDFVLDHPAVSRVHLIVSVEGNKTVVADNHTRNETLVNGDRLIGERELVDGDLIEICGILLRFHADEKTEREAK